MRSEGRNPYQLIAMQTQVLAPLPDALSQIYQQTSTHMSDQHPRVLEAGAERMFRSDLSTWFTLQYA